MAMSLYRTLNFCNFVYCSSLGGPQQDVEGAGHTRDRDTLPQEEILLQRCKRRRKVNYRIDKVNYKSLAHISGRIDSHGK